MHPFSISQPMDGNCSFLLLPKTTSILLFSLRIVGWQLNLFLSLRVAYLSIKMAFSWSPRCGATYVPSLRKCISKPVVLPIEEKAVSLTVFYFCIFSVVVAVPTYLCVICRHFCCPMSLFQGHVTCRNFTLRGPLSFLIDLHWKAVKLFFLTTLWVLKYS